MDANSHGNDSNDKGEGRVDHDVNGLEAGDVGLHFVTELHPNLLTKVQFGCWGDEVFHYPSMENTQNSGQITELEQAVGRLDLFPSQRRGVEVIAAFIGHQGFFVFRRDVNLLGAFARYLQIATANTCGECAPCRDDGKVLYQYLVDLQRPEQSQVSLAQIRFLAQRIARDSQCGIGKYSTFALAKYLEFFPEEFQQQLQGAAQSAPAHYYHHITAPCIENCPAHLDVPKYLAAIRSNDFSAAASIIVQDHPMLGHCGDICQGICEAGCTRRKVDHATSVRKVKERFLKESMDKLPSRPWKYFSHQYSVRNQEQKVAVLGSSAAALASSYYLLLRGYQVDLFLDRSYHEEELLERVLPYYRLSHEQMTQSLEQFISNGGRTHRWFAHGTGQNDFLHFSKNFSATLIAFDQGDRPHDLYHRTGETAVVPVDNRIHGLKFLLDYCLNRESTISMPDQVCVFGGNSLALHCALTAKRGKALQVRVLFAGKENEMTAHPAEIAQAVSEGVILQTQVELVRITTGSTTQVEVEYLDNSGKGDKYHIRCGKDGPLGADRLHYFVTKLLVTCSDSHPWWKKIPNFRHYFRLNDSNNTIQTDGFQRTGMSGVFAAGECANGPLSLISAFADGKKVAKNIDNFLLQQQVREDDEEEAEAVVVGEIRHQLRKIAPRNDVYRWQGRPCFGVNGVHSSEEAATKHHFDPQQEAGRCLRCYEISLLVTA